MMRRRTALLLLSALVLAACGQKGPLFLPDDARPGTTAPADPAAADPAEDDQDEEDKADAGGA